MKPERCRYAASVIPMIQCALDEGHGGEHVTIKGGPAAQVESEVPAEPRDYCEGQDCSKCRLAEDCTCTCHGFFESRIRNQASNIIHQVFGPDAYPQQSAKGELEELITRALLAAHGSAPSISEQAQRAADKLRPYFDPWRINMDKVAR